MLAKVKCSECNGTGKQIVHDENTNTDVEVFCTSRLCRGRGFYLVPTTDNIKKPIVQGTSVPKISSLQPKPIEPKEHVKHEPPKKKLWSDKSTGLVGPHR